MYKVINERDGGMKYVKEKTMDFRWNAVRYKVYEHNFWGKRTKRFNYHYHSFLEQRCIMLDGTEEWHELPRVVTEFDFG